MKNNHILTITFTDKALNKQTSNSCIIRIYYLSRFLLHNYYYLQLIIHFRINASTHTRRFFCIFLAISQSYFIKDTRKYL